MKIKKQRKKTRMSTITMHRLIALNAAYDLMLKRTFQLYKEMSKTRPHDESKLIKMIDLFNCNNKK